MFERSEELDNAVRECLKIARSMERGDHLTTETIEEASGMSRDHPQWRSMLRKFRKLLFDETGIRLYDPQALGRQTKSGLAVPTAREQALILPRHRNKKARRLYRRAQDEAEAIPEDQLTPAELAERAVALQHLRRQEQENRRNARLETALFRPSQSNPRPFLDLLL